MAIGDRIQHQSSAMISGTKTTVTPTAVVVQIATAVLIPNYYEYYDSPIESFSPIYYVLGDGSLVAPPLYKAERSAHIVLILTGGLCAFFLMNIFTVIGYIRRGKIKNKSLFYLLLVSQIFGPCFLIPVYVSFFDKFANCYLSELFSQVFIFLSMSLLVTGIFGTKAYRCLNDSRVVLVALVALRGLSTGFVIVDMVNMSAVRCLAGTCTRSPGAPVKYLVATLAAQLAELLFISSCFFYALWQLKRVSDTRGRLSISVATESAPSIPKLTSQDGRGWWDYTTYPAHHFQEASTPKSSAWSKFWSNSKQDIPAQRKPSLHTEFPMAQPRRNSHNAPSTARSVMRFIPTLKQFAEVLQSELVFTAAITTAQAIVSAASLYGMSQGAMLAAFGWSVLNWILLSSSTLFSFRRVVRRHDQDAYQQQYLAFDPLNRGERRLYNENQNARMRRRGRSLSLSTNISSPSNPFIQRSLRSRESETPPPAPSIMTVDSALAVSWRVRVAPSILSTAPSIESVPLESYNGSETALNTSNRSLEWS